MSIRYVPRVTALFLSLLFIVSASSGDLWPEDDIVKKIPGFEGELTNRWFSGYVNVTVPSRPLNKLSYHYVLVEASENKESAPLILWTNGGPGASSLWGLFTEIGPLWLTEESLKTEAFKKTSVPTLFNSKTSWTTFANVLIMNGPPPVSFSYCEEGGPAGDGYSCGDWNDETTAEANFHFLEGFFKKFPVYKQRKTDFYLTGESYAGIYIPTLAAKILENKDTTSYELLKGIAIGDGCIGSDLICSAITKKNNVIEQKFSVQFLFGHGQVPTPLYERYIQLCDQQFQDYTQMLKMNLKSRDTSSFRSQRSLIESLATPTQECIDLYHKIREVVSFFDVYSLYDECWDIPNVPLELIQEQQLQETKYQPYPCGGSVALATYLALTEVKEALNIPKEAVYYSGDNGVGMHYTSTVQNLLPWHYSIAMDSKLRVLIYNGDTDHDLNAFFSEWWVNALELRRVEDWRAWTLDGVKEVVGYTMRFEGDYSYVTIRGSGHMVPTMKPKASFEMMKSWIAKIPLKGAKPGYDPTL